MQVEYATDLVFRSAATLGPLYDQLNDQSLAVIPWHRRCCPDASIHLAPRLKKVRVSPSAPGFVNPAQCDLGLNQARGSAAPSEPPRSRGHTRNMIEIVPPVKRGGGCYTMAFY
jgi:hypothetical protein